MAAKAETPNERAKRIGCVHSHYLSFAKKCEGCRKTPLTGPNYPDHVSRQMYSERRENGFKGLSAPVLMV